MKHKTIVVLCLLAVVTGTVIAVRVSDHYQAWAADRDAKAVAAQQHQIALDQEKADQTEVTLNKFHEGCVAGNRAYDVLTAVQREALRRQGVVRAVCER